MKKVLCCIPTLGTIRIELAQLLYLWKQDYGDFFDVYTTPIRPLYEARNDCVRSFLKSDASYLFFIDSDAVPPLAALETLIDKESNRKIVGGLCVELKIDSDGELKQIPMALDKAENGYNVTTQDLDGVIEVDATGTICVMIHRSVFSTLEEPWFFNLAEDFYFFEHAKAAGFMVYVNCSCNVKHYKVIACQM